MNKIISLLLLLVICCKGSPSETTNLVDKQNHKERCEIPSQILNYIKKHENSFKLVDINTELKLLHDFINNNICPVIVEGDFNQNGNKDVALILRYTDYKVNEFQNYNFPFLVIFNDYEKEVRPSIIYKTGDYAKEDIKTVIYDQFEEGIFSYIQKGNLCQKDIVKIVIPEKSEFYVIWNNGKQAYEYFNVLDDFNCDQQSDIIKKNDIFRFIKGSFEKDLCTSTNEIGTAICEDYQLTINPEYISVKTQGHMMDTEEKFFSRMSSKNTFQIYNDSNETLGTITIKSDSLFFKYSKFLEYSEEEMGKDGYLFNRIN